MRTLILVCTLLVALAAPAATFPVASATLGDPPESRGMPQLAAGRDGYLASWIDYRSGEPALFAARVAANGEVLDPTGIPLATNTSPSQAVWNGERYLVFFQSGGQLLLRTIAEDGTVGPLRSVVANAHVDPYEPFGVATNGQRIVVAYAGDKPVWNDKARARAAVLAMDGTVLDNLVLDERRTDRLHPSVAITPSGFAVAWNVPNAATSEGGLHLYAVRLDARGVRVDAQPRNLGRSEREAVIHANGPSLIADRDYETWFVSGDLVTTGPPVDRALGTFFTLRGTAAVIDREHSSHSSAAEPLHIAVVPYDAHGRPLTGTRVLRATADGFEGVNGVAAVQRGNDVLTAWTTWHAPTASRFRIFTALLSADSLTAKSETRMLTRSATAQRAPSIAAGEHETLTAWLEPGAIYAARLAPDGRQLDGPGIRLDEAWQFLSPRVVYHRGRYAVAYVRQVDQQTWEARVRFVSPSQGLLPEIVRIPVQRPQAVTLASGGGALVLVVVEDGAVRATRIHEGGTFDPLVTVTSGWWPIDPVVSWNGSHFLIAWVDGYLDFDWFYQLGISGRRMTADLSFPEAEPRVLVTLGTLAHHDEPSLASNGSEWFLTWTHFTSPWHPEPPEDERKQIRIVRIAADGVAESREGSPLARGFGSELAWTGSRLVLAWKDDAPSRPLFVAPLTADGKAVDAAARRTLDPAGLLYEHVQVSLTRWQQEWVAAYPRLGGADTGFVPRVLVTFEGKTRPKRRAISF